jgi:hypothetical protein
VSPRLPSKIKSVNSHQIDEVASRVIAKKVITRGSKNRVIISIERELNIRNPLETPAQPTPCRFISIQVATAEIQFSFISSSAAKGSADHRRLFR